MKVITLVPVKNESWILDFSLKNFSLFSDEILLLDDASEDDSVAVAAAYPKVKVIPYKDNDPHVNMSKRRTRLLEAGRASGGTHFVCLDADEVISDGLTKNIREELLQLSAGQKLLLPWILINRSLEDFVYSKEYEDNYKDFAFCDDKKVSFIDRALSEERTPGSNNSAKKIDFRKGCVYHFQNIPLKRNQYKQAWYRCNELLEGVKSPRRINMIYDFTKDLSSKDAVKVTDSFIAENKGCIKKEADFSLPLQRIIHLFEEKGILYFEPLDIWYLEELKETFLIKQQREPRTKKFPDWLIYFNTLKNKIINALRGK